MLKSLEILLCNLSVQSSYQMQWFNNGQRLLNVQIAATELQCWLFGGFVRIVISDTMFRSSFLTLIISASLGRKGAKLPCSPLLSQSDRIFWTMTFIAQVTSSWWYGLAADAGFPLAQIIPTSQLIPFWTSHS